MRLEVDNIETGDRFVVYPDSVASDKNGSVSLFWDDSTDVFIPPELKGYFQDFPGGLKTFCGTLHAAEIEDSLTVWLVLDKQGL